MKTSIKIKTDMASLVQAVSDLQRLTLKLAEENSLLAERLPADPYLLRVEQMADHFIANGTGAIAKSGCGQ